MRLRVIAHFFDYFRRLLQCRVILIDAAVAAYASKAGALLLQAEVVEVDP